MTTDFCLRNAHTLEHGRVDIAIGHGIIERIGDHLGPAAEDLDCQGTTVLPGFVDPHLHLDKVLTWSRVADQRKRGTFAEAIDATLQLRRGYTRETLLERGRAVLESAVVTGTTSLRAFADVGTVGGSTGVEALLALGREWEGIVDIQVVAFPQEGLLRDPDAPSVLERSLELGCHVVGAFPWYEPYESFAQRHLEVVFDLAKRHDVDVHAFVDDEPIAPSVRNLEQLALTTIDRGWEGRVTASHACGLASYDDHLAERTIDLVASAGISVCANAHVSLVSKCEHAPEPVPRGITRVRQLMDAGVNVTCGQDDVADPYYPFGRADMLEVASFLAHTAHLYRPADVRRVIEAVTVNAAQAMGQPDHGLRVGAQADLVALSGTLDATEILRLQPARRHVLKGGAVVAQTRVDSQVASRRRP